MKDTRSHHIAYSWMRKRWEAIDLRTKEVIADPKWSSYEDAHNALLTNRKS